MKELNILIKNKWFLIYMSINWIQQIKKIDNIVFIHYKGGKRWALKYIIQYWIRKNLNIILILYKWLSISMSTNGIKQIAVLRQIKINIFFCDTQHEEYEENPNCLPQMLGTHTEVG